MFLKNLGVADFQSGAAPNFRRHTPALQEYGIAGVLFMDNLAALADPNIARAGSESYDQGLGAIVCSPAAAAKVEPGPVCDVRPEETNPHSGEDIARVVMVVLYTADANPACEPEHREVC